MIELKGFALRLHQLLWDRWNDTACRHDVMHRI